MILSKEILEYIDAHKQEAYDLLITLAQIPAPSHHEEKRAQFCKDWLVAQGAEGVYIDDALNVVYPIGCDGSKPIVIYAAHTDVVFPDTDTLPLTVSDGKIFCPGVGDNTANAVALLTVAKYIAQNKLVPSTEGIMIVLNSCEEGLGNLKGTRKLLETFGSQVKEFVAVDGSPKAIINKAVGSKRYQVEIETEGGHSFGAFGNRNAIAYMASLINSLYSMKVPNRGKTTYNVGTISGGTSVNTIAQHAEMLYEFRSDNREDLAEMERHFLAAVEYYRTKGITVNVTLVGDRPCSGDVKPESQQALMSRIEDLVMELYGHTMTHSSGSTDCNIPLSMGIPAVCFGCREAAKIHTREEFLMIDSLHPGLKLAFALILHHF